MLIRKTLLFLLCSVVFINCALGDPVLHDTKNHAVQLSALKGKWVVVTYWASWCPSCKWEIPELNHLYKNNHDKNLVLYGVNYDNPLTADSKDVTEKNGIEFPVITEDPNPDWHLGDVDALPTTFIINPQGIMVKKIVGPMRSEALLDTIQSLKHEKTS